MPADPTPDDPIQVRRGDLRVVFDAYMDGDPGLLDKAGDILLAAVNAPVSPVVPLTRLREWIEEHALIHEDPFIEYVPLDALCKFIAEYERTTDGD